MSLEVKITTAETFDQHLNAYVSFLKRIAAENQNPRVLENMGDKGPAGLLYLIRPEREQYRRWTMGQGEIALLYDQSLGSIVGISAVEHSLLDKNISSGGNRCWLQRDYRLNNEVSRYLLSSNLEWSKQQGKFGMLLTFNDYNKGIYDIIVKRAIGGRRGSISNVWSDWWDDCKPIMQKIKLHNVDQWAVIKPCKPNIVLDNEIQNILDNFGAE